MMTDPTTLLHLYLGGLLFNGFLIGLFDINSPDDDPRTVILAAILWPLGVFIALGLALRMCFWERP